MIVRVISHLRANVIAYVALGFSTLGLGGGAYAAMSLPANSVGSRQIQKHSIDPVKFDPRAIGGSVRDWAQVSAQGAIVSASRRARDNGVALDGDYVISWGDTFSTRCVAIATPLATVGLLSASTGFANARIVSARPTVVWVETFNAQGTPAPAAFSLAIIC